MSGVGADEHDADGMKKHTFFNLISL